MQKKYIAASVIIALGLVWAGSAWYTGKQLEKNMEQLVQKANQQLNDISPELRLKLSYQDFQRGVFSSHVRFFLHADILPEDNSLQKTGQGIELNETIDHGPFPLAQLRKFNLIPAMALVHSEVISNEALQPLFALTGGKSPLLADTQISYSGATSTNVTFLPLDFQHSQKDIRFKFAGAKLLLKADEKGDQFTFNGDIGAFSVTGKNDVKQDVHAILNGMTLNATTHLSPAKIRVGSQQFVMDKLSFSVGNKEALSLQGLKIQSSFDADEKQKIAGNIDYRLDNIQIKDRPFGQTHLLIKVANLDAQAVKTFSEKYQEKMSQILELTTAQDNPELYQQSVNAILTKTYPILLKGGPEVTIAPLSWKNDKGESTFTLNMKFLDPATTENQDKTLMHTFNSVDSTLTISQAMAIEMMKQVAMVDGNSEEQAAKQAAQQVNGLAAMGQMFKIITLQDNNIISSLQYADNQISINGKKMPMEEFLSGLIGQPEMSDDQPLHKPDNSEESDKAPKSLQ
ncbi:YdgA family protein [Enterobacteriaceae bacterium LUAb1]